MTRAGPAVGNQTARAPSVSPQKVVKSFELNGGYKFAVEDCACQGFADSDGGVTDHLLEGTNTKAGRVQYRINYGQVVSDYVRLRVVIEAKV
jgi:hypothetical protein